ncbi:hypothetical protein [Ilumatobacter sp.]|uniref:hypothetical protein n=1 Tax=Ilumatobacter sp. TaxID=1967498 RepID=UPI003B5237B2
MPIISAELLEVAARRHGVVTTAELVADGLTHHDVADLARRRALRRRHNGVHLLAGSPLTFEARCVAACLADREAVVTGPAAGRLWGFEHVFRPNVPEVLVGHDRTPISRGVTLRRTNVLDDVDVVERPDSIRVASPPRAWFDSACHLPDERFALLTDWVLAHHASIAELHRTVRRLDTRGRTGLARVRRVMSEREDWRRLREAHRAA